MAEAAVEVDAGLVALAERLANSAGAVIRTYFRRRPDVNWKADLSPVTVADRAAEEAMRDILARECPGHCIIGEEHGTTNEGADWTWVLDPIDGTRAFVAGRASFGILVGLLYKGQPVAGVIDQPIAGDRWVGRAGWPTTFNGLPCRTSDVALPGEGILATTSPDLFAGDDLAIFNRARTGWRDVLFGGDCHNYGLLASGFIQGVIESGLKLHDFAALVPVVEGAGGVMSDWAGAPLAQGSDGRVLAAGSRALHQAALEALQG